MLRSVREKTLWFICAVLLLLFPWGRLVYAYETGEASTLTKPVKTNNERKLDIGDQNEKTEIIPTTAPAAKQIRGEGHFATTIDENENQVQGEGVKRTFEERQGGDIQEGVDKDTGKRKVDVGKDTMVKEGNDWINSNLDEKQREEIKKMAKNAKKKANQYEKARANVFDPESVSPEELERYKQQTQEPVDPNKKVRIIDDTMYDREKGDLRKFIEEAERSEVEEKIEDGRIFKAKVSEQKQQKASSIPPELITDETVIEAAKFACEDTFGKHYAGFDIAEARKYKMPNSSSEDDHTYVVTLDVYFPGIVPHDPNTCTVEIFTVKRAKGKFTFVNHEISPLECMDTPKHKRSGRVWNDLQQRHKEL